jgi:uncharacterized protein (DUF433 family)
MQETRITSKRNRVQFDLRPEQVGLLDLLGSRLGSRSRADLLQEAIGALLWFVQEKRAGRKVISVDPSELSHLQHAVELAIPSALLASADVYDHLVQRPHPWRRQLSLKGRNMTVGQLVASMRANGWSAERAADEYDLSLAQVQEALAYYAVHQALVDEELREEGRRLRAKGYRLEPDGAARSATE